MKNLKLKDLLLISMFLFVIIIHTIDFIEDIFYGVAILHIAMDILTVCLSILGIVMLILLINNRSEEISTLHQQVEKAEGDLQLSQSKLKEIGQEYSKYIREQFTIWGLTPSEKEVALILLRGLSFNEIAKIRDTKEKTVRQQASAIYHKAHLTGRHEFSAWFFEDMLEIASVSNQSYLRHPPTY